MPHPLLVRLGRTRAFTRLAPHLLPRCDLAVHRLTRGRWVPSSLFVPTVVLTTTGHRTGLPRSTPLCAHPGPDGSWIVVGSNFGLPRHPAWSTNLLHHPQARLTAGGRTRPVTAHLLSEEERNRHRHRIRAAVPVYDTYAARAQRDIRVFRLVPHPHA
ncbi:nitroreductase/quinone reductase family protein [Streptomyces sp. JJ36]|uniref:nitroreductase/quinone reductase family protein n=1 Tax=Streptomyces sp. JJ36 TaxID=2736645 RepID=UPI001F2091E1|nr:nitroreductase/quinone reductase family protein [Streptomyces sp. JJ36]MCF6524569.1 nitroreductase family deazaflavin-dependent oxidoreductase [Streptomyces sp. JJ36]